MFDRMIAKKKAKPVFSLVRPIASTMVEGLEDRCLMWGGPGGFPGGGASPFHDGGVGRGAQTIEFSQAPTAVQTGLTSLAATDSVAAPTASQKVYLGNSNGVESYTLDILSSGTDTRLTVDQNGDPVTAATQSTTTFGAITDTAATDEITAIATALNLTTPTTDTSVDVSTASDGTVTYSLSLASSTSTSTTNSWDSHGTRVSVDASGDPVGNERLPLSVLSTAVQNALTAAAPSGATALTSTSLIDVRTLDGVTTYSASYTSSGAKTTVTVDTTGALTSLPSSKQVDFDALPSAAQTELQTLATADGVSGDISTTQTVTQYTETNGTIIYSVSLSATDSSDTTDTYTITLSVDQDGNPTIPSSGGFGFGGGGPGFGGDCGGGPGGESGTDSGTSDGGSTSDGSTSDGSTTDTSSSSSTILTPVTLSSASVTAASTSSTSTTDTTTTTTTGKHHKKAKHAKVHKKHHAKA